MAVRHAAIVRARSGGGRARRVRSSLLIPATAAAMLAGCAGCDAPARSLHQSLSDTAASPTCFLRSPQLDFAAQVCDFDGDPIKRAATLIAQELSNGKAATLDAMLDPVALLAIATAGLEDRHSLCQSVADRLQANLSIGELLLAHIGDAAKVRLVCLKAGKTQATVVYRIVSEQRLDFLEITLVADEATNTPHITDLTVTSAGEPLSATIRRALLTLRLREGMNTCGAASHELAFIEHRARIDLVNRLLSQGRFHEADRLWTQLPCDVHRSPTAILDRLRAVAQGGHIERFESELALLPKEMSNIAPVQILALAARISAGDLAAAAASARALERCLGDDGYLRTLADGLQDRVLLSAQ